MTQTFLEKIVLKTRQRVASTKREIGADALNRRISASRKIATPHKFRDALSRDDRTNIIAEIKRASPSKGIINDKINVAEIARNYESGGAAAISVLTETEYFGGSLADLLLVSQTVLIPILRKDFIVDEYQIYEAAAMGADAILLIVAALSIGELTSFRKLAEDNLGMDALVEVHNYDELEIAAKIGAGIIGVNNRDLHSLEVSLDVSRQVIADRPENTLMVAESGISNRHEIVELKRLGFDGFLIGETLMRTANPAETLGAWI